MVTAVEEREAIASPLPISSETVGEVIRNIEAKYDLLQYEVDGWCVWPVLRFSVAKTLMRLSFAGNKEPFRLRELVFFAAKDLFSLLFPGKSRYFVLTFSSALMEVDEGRYKDVFFDDLLRELGSFFKIEKLNNKSFLTRRKAAFIKSNCTTTAFDLLSTLILPKFRRHPDISRVAGALSTELSREPGLELFTSRLIGGLLEDFYWRKKLFAWLLGRIRPQYLFTADGFSDHAAIAAAKEREIKVCELQHGGFIKGGPEYGWSSYAASYRAIMPVPDRFFLYGQHWKEQLEGDGFWEAGLVPIGSTRLDHYRKLKSLRRRSHKDDAVDILLTTQGLDTKKLIAFIGEFLQLADKSLLVSLTIKMHPAYESDKRIYEKAFSADHRVRIISGSETPSTFELLTTADLHLSISSTCHYDALGLGVPTVILPFASSGWVLPLHQIGHAFLATTAESLLEIVWQFDGRGVPDDIGAYYFQPGALENLKTALGVNE
jgi:hypothetical protein